MGRKGRIRGGGCRRRARPKTATDAFKKLNMDVYAAMQGPNQLLYGNLSIPMHVAGYGIWNAIIIEGATES